MAKAASKDARYFRAGQLAAKGLTYLQAKAELTKKFKAGIRKTEYHAMQREVTGKPKRTTTKGTKYRVREVEAPRKGLPTIKDAPRIDTEAPQIRQGMIGVSRIRSKKYRRYYYVDIRFHKLVFTKKRMTVGGIRYTTIYLGTYTPSEFRKAVYSGYTKQAIERELYALAGEIPPYTIEGYWTSKKAKEKV